MSDATTTGAAAGEVSAADAAVDTKAAVDARAADATDLEPAGEIRIVSAGVTAQESAAALAVVQAALAESAELAGADAAAPVSQWRHNQRPIRAPLTPGPGAWNARSW
ncbi:MAG: acyl-CoA carboxylase epsilon subunit [Rhodoglobus sp.]